ncbi:hypothetical protein NGM44_07195 [Moraxella sp. FZFQ2102]|uniref:hypothetical protein n=1 Tax=Moraxella sp. FZFQ2102 TaxID=2953752 RepID=UPI00209BCAEA|nr:hypothetical protein [Moraxella sp. FZFQ2102]USZ14180.1 hypothetical protein NGM44_07195 [Moraxella sp. FZFQ2102]
MKKFLAIALLGFGLAASGSALAGAAQMFGKTTCYVFSNGKLQSKAQCQMYKEEGANSVYPTYGFDNYKVKTPKHGVISVINSTSCERENWCESEHTINGKNATSQYRAATKGYKILTEDQAFKTKGALICDKTNNGKLEICTPIEKKGLSMGFDFDSLPSWTEN